MTPDDLREMAERLRALPRVEKSWNLISPDGLVYVGSADEMMRVLAPHHSLMQSPLQLQPCNPNDEIRRQLGPTGKEKTR